MTDNKNASNILETAEKIMKVGPICDRCLGRQFGWLSTDSSNEERGRSIKLVLSMQADNDVRSGRADCGKELIALLAGNGMFGPAKKIAEKYTVPFTPQNQCILCTIGGSSVFDKIPDTVERVLELIKDIEYDNFLVGSKPSPKLGDLEDELRAATGILYGESIKSEFNRELGKALLAKTGKDVEFQRPDLVVIYDMNKDTISLQISPIFIYGRYRKLKRGIPQSRWDCKACGGRGCKECNGTGRRYPDSIAEYISTPILEASKGTQFAFHAAGREDIDALMLGDGRPFVVEISRPRVRRLDLEELASEINKRAEGKVEVHSLKMTTREVSQTIKDRASENIKEYEALIKIENPVDVEAIERVEEALRDIIIDQRTPKRVSHRRADKIRKKRVYEVRLERLEGDVLKGFFKVQGGTYIKELISGDDGRTHPSIAELLGTKATCVELNVTAIYEDAPDHNA